MGRNTIMRSTVLVAAVFAVLLVVGSLISSEPSSALQESGAAPTTTTTTEPPPEGVAIVRLSNGSFRPSNLKLDPAVTPIVQWINEDPREYELVATDGSWESGPLGQGDTFEVDFSEYPPAINRYNAIIGRQRIPGSVDTRPEQ